MGFSKEEVDNIEKNCEKEWDPEIEDWTKLLNDPGSNPNGHTEFESVSKQIADMKSTTTSFPHHAGHC